jgi:hypothetical protein
MKASRQISLLLLLAMSLSLVPGPNYVASESVPLVENGPCSSAGTGGCDESACGDEPSPQDDGCCEAGCRLCSLPCCAGTFMLATIAQAMGLIPTANGQVTLTASELPCMDADPIEHPPRA